jgi:hypothetical protein
VTKGAHEIGLQNVRQARRIGPESADTPIIDPRHAAVQVVPTAPGRYLSDPDRKKADRAMQAMMKMQKIVIADLDKAYAG